MATTSNLKQKKKESGRILEKQSQGKRGKKSNDKFYYVNGERIEIADDLLDLPEIDYNDPAVKKWLAEEEAERIRKYGKLTHEEFEFMYMRRLELQKELPRKSVEELNKMALAEFRARPKAP